MEMRKINLIMHKMRITILKVLVDIKISFLQLYARWKGRPYERGLSDLSRVEFEIVPHSKDWRKDIKDFDSLVILPTRRLHDSGYRCMAFVACKGDRPIVRLGGGSDVVHLDGIGGFGYNWLRRFGTCPSGVPPAGWCIDCLKTSGLLRLFTHDNLIADGSGCSSFELYADPEKKGKHNVEAQPKIPKNDQN